MLSLRGSTTLWMGFKAVMRRLFLLVVLPAALAWSAGAQASTLFVVNGQGWGHGTGMSQWGAFGMARGYGVDGPKTWQEIIAHYFHSTTIGDRDGNVGVFLAGDRSSVTIGPAFEVEGGTHSAQHSGDSTVTPTTTGRIKVSGVDGTFPSPATFSATGGPLHLNGRHYRGKLRVSLVGGKLRVVNSVAIEGYVRGVVPNESPSSWGDVGAQAALEAQAVAARSYALYTVEHG